MLKEFADIFPVLLAGMAIGCMLMAVLQRIGRRSASRHSAVIKEEKERAAFDRGYAAALGVRSSINDQPARKRRAF